MSKEPLNIYQRINAIMSEVSIINKDASVGTGRSSYKAVSHDNVTSKLHDLFVKYGVIMAPSVDSCEVSEAPVTKYDSYNKCEKTVIVYRVDVNISIRFVNIDCPTDEFFTKTFAYSMDNSDKATGKAYSYAVKYALLKLFMIESGDKEEQRIEHDNQGQSRNYPNSTPDTHTTVGPERQSTSGYVISFGKYKDQVLTPQLLPDITGYLTFIENQPDFKGWTGKLKELKDHVEAMKGQCK